MAVEQEMSPIDKFIRGLISEEEYLALISGEEPNDPNFFENLNRSTQELMASGWAGVRVLGEVFDNEDMVERADQGVAYREQVSSRFGRPMVVEDIENPVDAVDWLFTSAVPQVLPSLAVSLPSAYVGTKTGAALGAPFGPVGVAIGGTGGFIVGALLPSAVLNIGEIDREIKERAGEDVESGTTALGYGALAAAVDVVGLSLGLKAVLPRLFKNSPIYKEGLDKIVDELETRGVTKTVATRAVQNAVIASVAEGSTEATQELIADFAAEQKTGVAIEQSELESRVKNAFALGAVGGFPVGAASGYMRGREVQKDLDAKKINDETEARVIKEVEQFSINNDLENLNREQLASFVVDNYIDLTEGGVNPLPIDLTLPAKDILKQIKALEFQLRFIKGRQEIAETATLPELQRDDLIRKEMYLLDLLDNNSIRTRAVELGLNLSNYRDIQQIKEAIAKETVDSNFIKSPTSNFLIRPKDYEESVAELSQLSRSELEYRARELLPQIYGRPGTSTPITDSDEYLISAVAEREIYLKRSKETLASDDETMVVLVGKDEQTRTYQNEIKPETPERSNVLEFAVELNGQVYVFEKQPKLNNQQETIGFDYILQGTEDTFDNFQFENMDNIDKIDIKSIVVRKGDYPQFKPGIMNRIKSFFNKYLASTKGYTEGFFEADRQRIGRIRAINSSMQFLAKEFEEAKNAAIRNGNVVSEEDVNKLAYEYLTNRYEKKVLNDPDDPVREILIRKRNEIQNELDRTSPNSTRQAHLKKQIEGINQDLNSGVRTSVTTLADLPAELRAPLLGMRSMIDRLVQRLLDEMPAEVLGQLKKVRRVNEDTGEVTLEEEPARDILQATMGSYLTEQYKLFEEGLGWNPRNFWNRIAPSEKVRNIYDDAVNKIMEENPNINKKQARRLVDNIIAQSLDDGQVSGKVLGSMYKLSPEQETISPIEKFLSQKQALPKEFKALFGEFDNPAQAALSTVSKLATFVENYRFYNRLKDLNEQTGERMFTTSKADEYNTLVPLDDTPLDGLYTTKAMAEAMRIVQKDKDVFTKWIYEPIVLIPKFVVQSFKTIFSPMAQARNFITAGMFYAVRNGNLWKDFPAGARGVWTDLGGSFDSKGNATMDFVKARQLRDFLESEGIINTEVRTGEIVASFEEAMSGGYKNMSEFLTWLMSHSSNAGGFNRGAGPKPMSFLKKAIGYPQKTYTAADDFWKIAAFVGESRKLKRHFNNTEEGQKALFDHGKRLGAKLIDNLDYDANVNKIASYIVRNTIPNYDYIGTLVDFLRKKLPFAPFVAFPTEIIRTAANQLRIGSVEATSNNFGTRVQGLRGITGLGLATYGFGAILQELGKALNNLDDEDIEYIRKLVPYFSKNSLIIPIDVKDGEVNYIDGSHFLVYDTISRMSQTVLNSVADGKEIDEAMAKSIAKGFGEAFLEFSGSYASLSIAPELIFELSTESGRDRIANPELITTGRWGEYAEKLVNHVIEVAQPGFIQQLNNVKKGLTPDEFSFNKYSTRKEFDDALMALAGVKISRIDIGKTMPFIINDAKRAIERSEDLFEKLVYAGGSVPPQKLIEEYYYAQKGSFLAQQELFLKYVAALSLAQINNSGYQSFEADINKQIKDRLGRKQANRFRIGEFNPFKYSKKSEKYYNDETEKMFKQGYIPSEGREFPRDDLDLIFSRFNSANISLLMNANEVFPDLDLEPRE